jgi:hypothetical protein
MRQPIDLYAIKCRAGEHVAGFHVGSQVGLALWPHWGAMFRRGEHPFRVRDFWSTSHPLTTPPLRQPAHDPEGDDQ